MLGHFSIFCKKGSGIPELKTVVTVTAASDFADIYLPVNILKTILHSALTKTPYYRVYGIFCFKSCEGWKVMSKQFYNRMDIKTTKIHFVIFFLFVRLKINCGKHVTLTATILLKFNNKVSHERSGHEIWM